MCYGSALLFHTLYLKYNSASNNQYDRGFAVNTRGSKVDPLYEGYFHLLVKGLNLA